MAATRKDVDEWIHQAKKQKCSYIISVCDTYDWDDYPVYCKDREEVVEESANYNRVNMQKINEIIRINDDGTVEENLSIYTI